MENDTSGRGIMNCKVCGKQAVSYIDMSIGGVGDFRWFCPEHEKGIREVCDAEDKQRKIMDEVYNIRSSAQKLRITANEIEESVRQFLEYFWKGGTDGEKGDGR